MKDKIIPLNRKVWLSAGVMLVTAKIIQSTKDKYSEKDPVMRTEKYLKQTKNGTFMYIKFFLKSKNIYIESMLLSNSQFKIED